MNVYYFFRCSQQHRCPWRGYTIENVSKSKKIPLNINYPFPITSQPLKFDIIILCMPTTQHSDGSSVVGMGSSSSGFIPSIDCALLITVVWPTEQQSSGCATSFMAFYHHHEPWHDPISAINNPFIDEPPGSVCSEFVNLSIHHPIPSKQLHYNPHILHNTANSQ